MFTVIIYKKSSQPFLDKYKTLFEPYIISGQIAFCFWNEHGCDFNSALPDLNKYVRGRQNWRAIVAIPPSDQEEEILPEKCDLENPFDFLCNDDPDPSITESKIPLIRLAQILGGIPLPNRHYETTLISVGKDGIEDIPGREDIKKLTVRRLEKDSILQDQQRKWEALDEKYSMTCSRPSRLYLFHARIMREINIPTTTDIRRHEIDSSLFWYRNRYPASARFLIQDCVGNGHACFKEHVFRFWMTTLLIALNLEPSGTYEAYKVYQVTCNMAADEVRTLFSEYYNRLADIRFAADRQISRLQKEASLDSESGELPDYEQNVDVHFEFQKENDLIISSKRIGLAGDCPIEEEPWWYNAVDKSKEAMLRLYNSTRIILDRASALCRYSSKMTDSEIHEIDEYRMTEMEGQLLELEQDILTFSTYKVLPLKKYGRSLEYAKKSCATSMRKRMTRNMTILAGIICLLVYFIGFLPDIVFQWMEENSLKFLFEILFAGAVILTCSGIGCLLYFRRIICAKIWDYDGIVSNFINDLNNSGRAFSDYLTKCCSYMRGRYMLQSLAEKKMISTEGIIMYKNHVRHLTYQMDVIRGWMLDFESDILPEKRGDNRRISFDFSISPDKNTDYYMNLEQFKLIIPFCDGSDCRTPYPFIKDYIVTRVPLYEKSICSDNDYEERLKEDNNA